MKRFTRMIATLLLGVMLMTTLTGCNRYYYYYYINVINNGSGSSDDDDFSSFPSDGDDDTTPDMNDVWSQLIGHGTGSVTEGNPTSLTKAYARLMESIIPLHVFSYNYEAPENTSFWANSMYQSVTVVASENADNIARECGLGLTADINPYDKTNPALDNSAIEAAKSAVAKYGDKDMNYFVGIVYHPVGGTPNNISYNRSDGLKFGQNLIHVPTDTDNTTTDFIMYYKNDSDIAMLYTVGTYRLNRGYIIFVISR